MIFETRTFAINGVAGLTNIGAVKAQQLGTCSSCHNQVNTGNDSFVAAQHDIGIGGTSPAPGAPPVTGAPNTFPQPSTLLPIFELDCTASGKTTVYQGPKVVTNDPGLAMITGKCADIGRFTVPQMRGLAARAPYFSDGSAATLLDVVSFYNTRFSIGLSLQDEQDLVAFFAAFSPASIGPRRLAARRIGPVVPSRGLWKPTRSFFSVLQDDCYLGRVHRQSSISKFGHLCIGRWSGPPYREWPSDQFDPLSKPSTNCAF